MAQIEWNETFSVNIPEIDQQHQEWIRIHNMMDRTMLTSNNKTALLDVLQAMMDYTRYHFEFEEELMREMGFPDVVEHEKLHKEFDDQVNQFYRKVQDGASVRKLEFITLIKVWLVDHIMVEDKKYGTFALSLGK